MLILSLFDFFKDFFSEVPNSLHMPSLAWVISSKILTPWSCQQSCHHARYLAQAVLMEIYPEVLISWGLWGISVFASKSWGKITQGLWKLLPHSANEKCKHRKLKNNIYIQHCLSYDYIYPEYEKWNGIKHTHIFTYTGLQWELVFSHVEISCLILGANDSCLLRKDPLNCQTIQPNSSCLLKESFNSEKNRRDFWNPFFFPPFPAESWLAANSKLKMGKLSEAFAF